MGKIGSGTDRLGLRREFLRAAIACISLGAWGILDVAGLQGDLFAGPTEKAYNFLAQAMDQFQRSFDIYTDVGAAGNHCVAPGKMPDAGAAVSMNDTCTLNPRAGATCIECAFTAIGNNWGGFYRLNGILRAGDTQPIPNWGEYPAAGFNLTGASEVTFWARGAVGGERVEFFVGGVGWGTDWQGNSTWPPVMPYYESFPKVSTGYVTLGVGWRKYRIKLRGWDLSYVLGGFGWVTNAVQNANRSIVFYLDDIQWKWASPDALRFLVSYQTNLSQEDFEVVMRNVAFTYDNALALLAFLARGKSDDLRRARILADSFVYAAENDRYYSDYRLRNAYSGGDLILFPGWTPNGRVGTARMPGFWDPQGQQWFEHETQVSTDTGNIAWAIIALVAAHQRLGNGRYLDVAKRLGEWVESNCGDPRGAGGYKGGFRGWEPSPTPYLWKSTEHNLDTYVAFSRLFDLTGDMVWLGRALHARSFVEAMWDDSEGKFWTGTLDDGITENKAVIPLDAQAWSVLAFRDNPALYARALTFAEQNHAVGGGFDFDTDRDGVWYEGTAHMAAAYQVVGQRAKALALLTLITGNQMRNGAIPAASKDRLTTGFDWLYYRRGHVGATAWYALARLGVNPYWLR